MSACASAFSHQRCLHACTVSAACEKSNLGTVRTLRCVPSIASAAFVGQIEFLPRTCSTQFCRFGRKEEKKNYLKHRSEGHKSDHVKCLNFEVVDLSLRKSYKHRSSTSTKLVVRAKARTRFQVLPARGRVPAIAQKRYIFRDVMP